MGGTMGAIPGGGRCIGGIVKDGGGGGPDIVLEALLGSSGT